MTPSLFIGLMSGTSMDGIDAVLVDLTSQHHQLLGHSLVAWPDRLRSQLQDLTQPGNNEIERMGIADALVADQFANATNLLLKESGYRPDQITAIGSHGQTIRHSPDSNPPFTLQIGDPNRIAQQTEITVVADFRRRDMAAGGQGAPLTPGYHQARFHSPTEERVILNLGGIANITVVPKQSSAPIMGFDTGPANTLMDAWIKHHQGLPRDDAGKWAATGRVNHKLLEKLLADAYFDLPPPKSSGPEYFNLHWLERLTGDFIQVPAEDIQATLIQLSCQSIVQAIKQHSPGCQRVIACGGGVHNNELMRQLAVLLNRCPLESSQAHGIDPDLVEATAFAWLAQQTLAGLPGNLPDVTGASRPVVLGGIYPN